LIDRHSTNPDWQPYIEQAGAMTLPVLFLVDDNGEIVYEGLLPANVDAAVALIRKYRGTQ
jgi:hypothetical protein